MKATKVLTFQLGVGLLVAGLSLFGISHKASATDFNVPWACPDGDCGDRICISLEEEERTGCTEEDIQDIGEKIGTCCWEGSHARVKYNKYRCTVRRPANAPPPNDPIAGLCPAPRECYTDSVLEAIINEKCPLWA